MMGTTKSAERRRGQVLLLSIFALALLCVIAALTVDVGSLFVSRAKLQNSADAAAKAALLELWEERAKGEEEDCARLYAEGAAISIAHLNYSDAGREVVFGRWDGTQFTPCSTSIPANAVRVRAFRDSDALGGADPTFFGGAVGVDSVAQAVYSVARFRHKKLLPFAIYEPDIVGPGQTLELYNDTLVTPGVFGLIDFDGGQNAASDTVEWTRYGYEGPVYIDPTIGFLTFEGNPGFQNVLLGPIRELILAGEPCVAVVYRDCGDGGANTWFEVVGFVEIVITDVTTEFVGKNQNKLEEVILFVTARVEAKYIPGTGETQGTMRDFMRLQLVE